MTETTSCRSPLSEPYLRLSVYTALHPRISCVCWRDFRNCPELIACSCRQHSPVLTVDLRASRTVSLPLSVWLSTVLPRLLPEADPDGSGCSTHSRQTLGPMETPSPYRWADCTAAPAEAILRCSMREPRRTSVSRSFIAPTRLWVARMGWYPGSHRLVQDPSDAAFPHSSGFSGNASTPSPSPCNWAGIPPFWVISNTDHLT